MKFAEEQLARYVNRNMDFQHIKVLELLPYLNCLTETDQEELRAIINNKGNQNAVWPLLNALQRRSNWPTYFIAALRRFEYTELADELQHQFDSLALRSHPNNTPAISSAAPPPPPCAAPPPPPCAAPPPPPPCAAAPLLAEAAATSAAMDSQPPSSCTLSSPSQDTLPPPLPTCDTQKNVLQTSVCSQAAPHPVIAASHSRDQSFPMAVSPSSAAASGHSSLSALDRENSSHHNYESLDLKTPILETQQSESEVSRTSMTTETRKVGGEDPQQHSPSPAAAVSKLGAEEPMKKSEDRHIFPKQITTAVTEPNQDQVTSRVSEEEKSTCFSKPGVLMSHWNEGEPYSGNSNDLQVSCSTAENRRSGANSSNPGDSRKEHLQDEFQQHEGNRVSTMNIDSNQLPSNSLPTVRNDPVMTSNSTVSSHSADFRVSRTRQPEENYYSYESRSLAMGRENRSAHQDKPDTKDLVTGHKSFNTEKTDVKMSTQEEGRDPNDVDNSGPA
ncbi:mitochondrial antiviral-signaling protein isoform X2 [Rhinatrema bivittatum]|uniref:mitochondrial antiviral-signaling protein isoform X2 n=1 Tax=Rhinatrema bivittatum TaxID=194408 RepID=UPI00112E4386|nr:mitochondrial antiviral-signaling protein isoform X2 [Rhinatrema bivittatum]